MNSPSNKSSQNESESRKGRLLIVDDDSFTTDMLRGIFEEKGHVVMDVASGEACLAVMDEFSPQIVLLDIDMPDGIDGYETCRRIRSQFDRANLTIIFLSGHDGLDDRLRAFDVGGDDFLAKPVEIDLLCRKITIAVEARLHRHNIFEEKALAEESATTLLQGYDELSAVLKFVRGALACRSLTALAELIVSSMRFNKVECMVQLRGSNAAGTVTMTPHGLASPLEDSVFDHMRTHGRIFQFKTRMIVNYDSVSVLVVNMPVDDEVLSGRIRDYAAILAEAAEDAVANVSLRADAVERAKALKALAESGHAETSKLRSSYQSHQADIRMDLETMVDRVESMYYRFGLSDRQESDVSECIRSSKNEVLTSIDKYGEEFDKRFDAILDGLKHASSYEIAQNEESAQNSEVWV